MADLVKPGNDPAPRDLLFRMADEIARSASDHIRDMYPAAIEATTPNMLRSLRGCIVNDIVSTLGLTDQRAMEAWLARQAARRKEIARLKRLSDRAEAMRRAQESADG